jgi:hypothetical protein
MIVAKSDSEMPMWGYETRALSGWCQALYESPHKATKEFLKSDEGIITELFD